MGSPTWEGMVGEGVFGPFDEEAVVYEECELPFKMEDDPRELSDPTRGEEVPEEYACCGWGRGREGNLSFTYNGR
jgi:hypothetical protein